MYLIETGAADHQETVRTAGGVRVHRPCAFEAWPMHAIRTVGIGGIECLSHARGGRDLQTQGWNTSRISRVLLNKNKPLKGQTWSTCSKNHAGRWLVSATSGGKLRIVLRPNKDILVNLSQRSSVTGLLRGGRAHCSLSTSMLRGSTAYIIWSRCFITDLRMPSSNSCRKSTTRVGYNLNPKGDSRSQKAFWVVL